MAVTRISLIPPQGDRPDKEEMMAGFRQWLPRIYGHNSLMVVVK